MGGRREQINMEWNVTSIFKKGIISHKFDWSGFPSICQTDGRWSNGACAWSGGENFCIIGMNCFLIFSPKLSAASPFNCLPVFMKVTCACWPAVVSNLWLSVSTWSQVSTHGGGGSDWGSNQDFGKHREWVLEKSLSSFYFWKWLIFAALNTLSLHGFK